MVLPARAVDRGRAFPARAFRARRHHGAYHSDRAAQHGEIRPGPARAQPRRQAPLAGLADAEGGAMAEIRGIMLADRHELVVLGHVERLPQRAIEAVEDCLPIGLRLSGAQRDVKKRHGEPRACADRQRTCEAVSYTHLDVYKRQDPDRVTWM